MNACFERLPKTGIRVEHWVRRAVHLSIWVTEGRGSRDTEGEGEKSRKSRTVGQVFKIRGNKSDRA